MKKGVILVIGLPGSGKTTLSDLLGKRLSAARINADHVRNNINKDLGFSVIDRREHARRMAKMAEIALTGRNSLVVVDFVCPNQGTRYDFETALHEDLVLYKVWMNTIEEGRFQDTNKMWENPVSGTEVGCFDYKVEGWQDDEGMGSHVYEIESEISQRLYEGMRKQYLIRFNTKADLTVQHPLLWRIIEVGTNVERLVHSFNIEGCPVRPKDSMEHNVQKWNISFTGVEEPGTLRGATHINFY